MEHERLARERSGLVGGHCRRCGPEEERVLRSRGRVVRLVETRHEQGNRSGCGWAHRNSGGSVRARRDTSEACVVEAIRVSGDVVDTVRREVEYRGYATWVV